MRRLALTCLLFAAVSPVFAQQEKTGTKLHPEFGFWVGASNPMPGTELDDQLDSNIGGGFFYRIRFPWILLTEVGFSYAQYFSRATQSLTVVPVYGALVYQLPLPFRMQIFLKLGGGQAYVTVRPENRYGWDPLGFAALEFSLQAARSFRVGLRLDYNLVYEANKNRPSTADQLLIISGNYDPRYQAGKEWKSSNGHFFHFGLMLSFYL